MPLGLADSLAVLPGLFWLLLPIAAASGWWLARHASHQPDREHTDPSNYVKGLNYLLDDQTDQALEVLTRLTDAHRETIDSQLILGNLLRRRGETDRAIYVHHSLLNRANLNDAQRQRALLELGEDYTAAGLLDRAEELFQRLLDLPVQQDYQRVEYQALALHKLIRVYEQGKEWPQALAHCDRLEQTTGQIRRTEAAQYCCELAQQAYRHQQLDTAMQHLNRAVQRNTACTRAYLLQAQVAIDQSADHTALTYLYAVEHHNPLRLYEALDALTACHERTATPQVFIDWLYGAYERYGFSWLAVHLARYLAAQQDTATALDFITQVLDTQPSFVVLRTWLELREPPVNDDITPRLLRVSQQLLDATACYQCNQCGFTSKVLHWQCPSCTRWETLYPLPDLTCRTPQS